MPIRTHSGDCRRKEEGLQTPTPVQKYGDDSRMTYSDPSVSWTNAHYGSNNGYNYYHLPSSHFPSNFTYNREDPPVSYQQRQELVQPDCGIESGHQQQEYIGPESMGNHNKWTGLSSKVSGILDT
jgi:hypothetical protein